MKKSQISLALVAALGLSACGSDSDDEIATEQPQEPTYSLTAAADAGESLNGESVTIDLDANDSYDGEGELSVSVIDSDDAAGSVSTDGTTLTFTPAEGFLGSTEITYEVTDGDLTAEAVVTIDSAETLSISGTVTDAPIADATVTVTLAGQTHEAEADADGNYQLDIKVSSTPETSAIRINAVGAEAQGQAYVTLSSLLASYEQLRQQAGDDRLLQRDEDNSVQVTQVSTARDVLIRALAGAETIAGTDLAELSLRIETEELLETAAIIKLLVDSPESYPLPDGVATVSEFLADQEAYDAMVTVASESAEGETSDLDQAIVATLNDDAVVDALTLEDIKGRYLQRVTGNKTIGLVAGASWEIGDDGQFIGSRDNVGMLPGIYYASYQEVDGQIIVTEESQGFLAPYPGAYNDGHYDDLDPELLEVLDAWAAENNYGNNRFVFKTERANFRGLSEDDRSIIVGYEQTNSIAAWEFDYQGETYQVPEVVTAVDQQASDVLTKIEPLQVSESSFNLADNPTWILPVLGLSKYADDPAVSSNYGYGDIVTLEGNGSSSGTFSARFTQATGDWQLSESGNTLTLSYSVAGHNVTSELIMQEPSSAGVLTVLNNLTVDDSGAEDSPLQTMVGSISSLRRIAPMQQLSAELISPNKTMARFLNHGKSSWKDGVPPTDELTSFWYFEDDGTVDGVRRYCDGVEIASYETCSNEQEFELKLVDGTNFVWSTTEDDGLKMSFNGFEPPVDYPFYTPVGHDEETGVIVVMEYWNSTFQLGCTPDSCVLQLYPRVKPWVAVDDMYPVSRLQEPAASEAMSETSATKRNNRAIKVEDTLETQ